MKIQKYSNVSNVPLSLAVFLASDSYDHSDDANTLSATALIKPLRQLVLANRVDAEDATADLIGMLQSRMGSAIHDAIERSWKDNHTEALKLLGYPAKIIERFRINPKPEEITPDIIPVYMEQRASKKVGKYTISGKFDFVGDGRLEDFKSTSVFTAIHNTNDAKYTLQGSIYRWLTPQLITKDEMAIQFIFTDWQAARARSEANYPQQRTIQRLLPLKSIPETDAFIRRKLAMLDQYWDAPEADIPHCTDEDLWRSAPVFKYYKNPTKMTRSTKNFETQQEAFMRKAEDGNVGVVIEQPGQVTACKYCAAFSACAQKDTLIATGDLQL